VNDSAGSLACGSVSGGFGRVTGWQVVNNSADILASGSGVVGFGRVTDRQAVGK
jgi:hypothetical protein